MVTVGGALHADGRGLLAHAMSRNRPPPVGGHPHGDADGVRCGCLGVLCAPPRPMVAMGHSRLKAKGPPLASGKGEAFGRGDRSPRPSSAVAACRPGDPPPVALPLPFATPGLADGHGVPVHPQP